MAGVEGTNGRRVERAIYLVGGLILFLNGISSISTIALNFYDRTANGGALPGPGSTFWVDNAVALFVGLLFLLAGLGVLYLAWRSWRTLPAA